MSDISPNFVVKHFGKRWKCCRHRGLGRFFQILLGPLSIPTKFRPIRRELTRFMSAFRFYLQVPNSTHIIPNIFAQDGSKMTPRWKEEMTPDLDAQ